MKKTVIIIMFSVLLLAGCAFVPLSSKVGSKIGTQFEKGYAIGTVSADSIKKNWPYVSGLIKSSFGEDLSSLHHFLSL